LKCFSIILFLISITISTNAKVYKSSDQTFKLEQLFDTEGRVWGFDFLNQNEILFTLKTEGLRHFNSKTKKLTEVLGAPKFTAKGQGGILDLQIHQGYVYITYTCEKNSLYSTCLGRGTYSNLKLKNFKTIFTANAFESSGEHFGSRVTFDQQGHLFMSVGERGKRHKSQSLKSHHGKILRMNLDGSDFKIWTFGHRNPQGIFFDRKSKRLWSSEFGPRGGDEVNLIVEGKNYGWPVITYGAEYYGPKIGSTHKVGMEQPIVHYTPSISPSAMTIYEGDKLKGFKGNMFLAALGSEFLQRIVLKGTKVVKQERLLEDLEERFRMVRTGPDGGLYFSTDSGKIFSLK